MKNQVTLFLMSRKGYRVLESIGRHFPDLIDCVVVGQDKNVQDDYYAEIKELCEQLEIPCYDRLEQHEVTSKYAIAISWRWLINLSETTLIVFHDSILPKYRGFNPLVSYLINGESKIGVTALFASEEYDKGDIINQVTSEISYPIKISEAIEIISENYVELANQIMSGINGNGTITGKPQDESEASYSLWRDAEDYQIDWTQPATQIRRFVDAVGFPYQGATTLVNNKLARVFDIEELEDVVIENRVPGKVIFIKETFPVVVCGQGLVKIISLVDELGKNLLPLGNFRSRFK